MNKAIPYARQWIDEDDIAAVTEVLRSDTVTQGSALGRFEAGLARATGAAHAVAVSNGTAALHLACAVLGLKRGATGVIDSVKVAAALAVILLTAQNRCATGQDRSHRLGLLHQIPALPVGRHESSHNQRHQVHHYK